MAMPPGQRTLAIVENAAFLLGVTAPMAAEYEERLDGDRYTQLLPTFDDPPGQSETPNTSRTPSHRARGWAEIKARGYSPPAVMRSSFSAHEYVLRNAADEVVYTGWFVVQRWRIGVDVWTITTNVAGPENGRTIPDYVMEAETPS